jgi:signal recognition particle subunit FFH/SRP54 (srp54)
VAETLKEVRKALLDADVNYKIAKTFTDEVKRKAMGMNVLNSIKPGQLLVKVVHDELAELMGGKATDINLSGNPAVILIAGLQGSGKTTFSGKLASHLKNKKGNRLYLLLATFIVLRLSTIKSARRQIGVPFSRLRQYRPNIYC